LGGLRVEPRRDFSSYQFDCLVASFVSRIWAVRSAAKVVVVKSCVGTDFEVLFELAVTMADFLRRFMRRPSSSVDV